MLLNFDVKHVILCIAASVIKLFMRESVIYPKKRTSKWENYIIKDAQSVEYGCRKLQVVNIFHVNVGFSFVIDVETYFK